MNDLDLQNLEKMIAEKYISVQKHPTLDLYIYNYTHKTQFDRVWNNETLQCRGLIMDGQGKIVSRPFSKFFNYGELDLVERTRLTELEQDFTVTEKMDGSLGISYFDPAGNMYIATRGSFVSEQAQKANQMWQKIWQSNQWKDCSRHPNQSKTYLFEILYPQNRIVVNYGDREDLVLLAIIDTKTGEEHPYSELVDAYGNCLSIVPQYDGITDFNKIEQRPNSEGYVVHFPSTNLRFKIKFDEYVRLHKILTGINAKRIWEILAAGQFLDDILERVPDEFYQWVRDTEYDLHEQYHAIELSAKNQYEYALGFPTRKDQALAIKDYPYKGIVFNMLDGKDYSKIIWKIIEPKWEKPFKEDET